MTSQTWVLILAGVGGLWEEQSFQFAFNYLKGDCVEVLSEWIQNEGYTVKENVKATSPVFVLLDFSVQVSEEERSVQEFRHAAVLRKMQD